jgi:crotonobetainyl-CoA:carnitine CoA-transferase CaiB-like acyl-CoA transferase
VDREAIACTSDQMFVRLAEVMEQPELASTERYGPKELRLAARDEVNRIVAVWVGSLDLDMVLSLCSKGGVPASLIFSIADIFRDPQYRARGNIQMTDSRAGEIAVPGVVPRLSETPGEIRWLCAGLGAQNEDIYKGLLELSSAEIEGLRSSGVI